MLSLSRSILAVFFRHNSQSYSNVTRFKIGLFASMLCMARRPRAFAPGLLYHVIAFTCISCQNWCLVGWRIRSKSTRLKVHAEAVGRKR